MKTIVVKLGTNSITNEYGELNHLFLQDLVSQIARVREDHNILFVSSGAMGAGRGILKKPMIKDDVASRQMFAVVGQVKLMEIYSNYFFKHGKVIAQMLATKQDFENKTHFQNTKNCIERLFEEGIVPILNENDFVCVEELMFTDNDELAGTVSKMLYADQLILLSNVDGVYDESGNVVPEFLPEDEMPSHIVTSDKSSFGKGGMQSKFKIAQQVSKHGTEVYIANSREKNVVLRLVNGEHLGTRFIPDKS